VLKSPLVFDDYNAYASPPSLNEFSPRISRADTPSPAPTQTNKKRPSVNYARPGQSKLSATVMDRSPSPPQPEPMRRESSEDGAVILRRKLEFPPPSPAVRTPSPQRLMLPPPPPSNAFSILYRVVKNPVTTSAIKVILFCAKAFSLLSPCQPFVPDARVLYPLLCLASVDFVHLSFDIGVMGSRFRLGGLSGSMALLLVHAIVVGLTLRWDHLCSRRGVTWDGI